MSCSVSATAYAAGKKPERRGVRDQAAVAERGERPERGRLQGIAEVVRPLEAVHRAAELLGRLEVVSDERPHLDVIGARRPRRAAHHDDGLCDVEAERGVER